MEDVLKKIYAVRQLSDVCPDIMFGMSVSELDSLCNYIDSLRAVAGEDESDFLGLRINDDRVWEETEKYNDRYHGFACKFHNVFYHRGGATLADVVSAVRSGRVFEINSAGPKFVRVTKEFLRDHGVDL